MIEDRGTTYVGPSDYERMDQKKALVLFRQWDAAYRQHPANMVGQVGQMMQLVRIEPRPSTPWLPDVMESYLTAEGRRFKAARAAHVRFEAGLKPDKKIPEPTPLPETLSPEAGREMVDPQTGEVVIGVVVGQEGKAEPQPPVDELAVLINHARTYVFEEVRRCDRRLEELEWEEKADDVAEARRRVETRRNDKRDTRRERERTAKYYELLEKVAELRPRYPQAATVEDVVRGEEIALTVYGLNFRKLREFLSGLRPGTGR